MKVTIKEETVIGEHVLEPGDVVKVQEGMEGRHLREALAELKMQMDPDAPPSVQSYTMGMIMAETLEEVLDYSVPDPDSFHDGLVEGLDEWMI